MCDKGGQGEGESKLAKNSVTYFMDGPSGLGLKTGPQFPTSTLSALPNFHSPGPTLAKSKKSPVFHTKITLLSLQPHWPTGHCPNASMASPPLTVYNLCGSSSLA